MAYKDLNDLYQQVLGRAPDAGGAQYWSGLDVNDPNQVEDFKRAAAPELAQTHYTAPVAGQAPADPTANATPPYDPNAQPNTIANLYQNVLGRNPEQAGLENWTKAFGGNTANAAQRQQFISSAQAELSGRGNEWQPQTQTYNDPMSPGGFNNQQSGKGGNSFNTNYGSQPAPTGNRMSKGGGKGGQTQGYQGTSTNSATSGQPQMGQPNVYPNTVGMKDNSGNTTANTGGKGKGV